ncbi:MAG: sulfurtransferase [Woeseiaceae bacterium]|nr:sulfurtransferase [Woeseiaceae bacterium]
MNPSDLVAKAKATIRECSVADAKDCVHGDSVLVDVREPAEFMKGHIPGAVLLPRGMIEFDMHKVIDQVRKNRDIPQEDTEIVLYCGTGGRSALAARVVEEIGYRNVRSMSGGIVAWAEAGLPVTISEKF